MNCAQIEIIKKLGLWFLFACATTAQAQVAQSRAVVASFRKGDLKGVAKFVGAEGLRFSASVFAEKSDRRFSRHQLRFLNHSPKKWNWGRYAGNGDPIILQWRDYFKGFILPRDLARSNDPALNEFESRGKAINNLRCFYKGASFVEFPFPATAADERDGTSLWLVWRKSDEKWVLLGVAHDRWTI